MSHTPTPTATSPSLAALIAAREAGEKSVNVIAGVVPFTYADIQVDIQRVIEGISRSYVDPTCVELHLDNLVAEGLSKVAARIDKGVLSIFAGRRGELFAHLRACVNNHIRGIVGRNRFTVKRTGHKPPPRGQINWDAPTQKPEVSLDDPDVHLQLQDHNSPEVGSLTADMDDILTPIELLVMRQLEHPNDRSALAAILQGHIKTKVGERPRRIDITDACHADGLGMPLDYFLAIKESLKTKVLSIMHESSPDQRVAAVMALAKLFQIHIPRSTDPVVVKRLLTVAARANYELVDDNAMAMLELAGAKAPKREDDGSLNCYGVLFSASHRACGACALRGACKTESANYGLGTVFISTDALPPSAGIRTARTTSDGEVQSTAGCAAVTLAPVTAVVASVEDSVAPVKKAKLVSKKPAVPASGKDDAIVSYLDERYRKVDFAGESYYKHATAHPDGRVKHIFWVGSVDGIGSCAVRFCGASAAIQKKLVKAGRSFYAPASMQEAEVRDLIDRHANYIWSNRE